MRHSKQTAMLTALIAGVVFLSACAKEAAKDSGADGGTGLTPATTTTLPTGDDTRGDDGDAQRGTDWSSGATASLVVDPWTGNKTMLDYYSSAHPLNNPQDIRISVKLSDHGGNQFGGQIFISYYDNNQYYTGRFYALNQKVAKGVSHGHEGKNYAVYNKWFSWGGKQVFHGFFQDRSGGIMLIVDQALDNGDGAGASELSGEIWLRNFAGSQAGQGTIPCWFIENGPYDCRTFLINEETVSTTSALYPTQSLYSSNSNPYYVENAPSRNWRRLGKFSGLNKAKAFGL